MQQVQRYTRTAIALHWAVAVLVIGNLLIIWTVGWYPDRMVRPAIDLHKSIGLTVLGLALMRVLWRWSHPAPALPSSYPRLERLGAHAVHLLLYLLILGLPLSGYIHDSAFKLAPQHPLRLYWLVPFPRIGPIEALDPATKAHVHAFWFSVHSLLGYVLYGLLAAHLLGALKHQFIDKEPELQRMLP